MASSGGDEKSPLDIDDTNSREEKVGGLRLRSYLTVMHLSLLLGIFVPIVGLVSTVALWYVNQDRAEVSRHGKILFNWILSICLYGIVAATAATIAEGINNRPVVGGAYMVLQLLVLLNVLFPIYGAMRAHNLIAWQYPFSIKFFKVEK